jgi:hypothetical protein
MVSPPMPAQIPDHLRCQTPECPNPIEVVVTRLEDSEADMLCMPCTMIFWLKVLQQAGESGLIPQLASPAPGG